MSARGAIRVEVPGLLTTVQDLGRFGHGELGVAPSGAADPLSLRIGNRLLGNADGAAALEMTLVGGTFVFERPVSLALAGSDFSPRLDGDPIPTWAPIEARTGQTLELHATRGGARTYLCVRGGIAVREVLGSASTHLLVGLGGIEGRSLRAGDRLDVGDRTAGAPARNPFDPGRVPGLLGREILRVTPGPQSDAFPDADRSTFHASPFRVTESSDRMGLRLEGPAIRPEEARELVSEGVSTGDVQIPPDGQPIVLMVEHPTTGGYPKIASVVSADFHALGQLRPRDVVRFAPVSFETALALLERQESALRELLG